MSTANFQHLSTTMVDEIAVAEILSRELRFPAQAQELGAELTLVAGQEWAKQLLINLKHTKYVSSTGFAVLFTLVSQARNQGRVIKFCEIDPEVRIGADIIGLDRVAEIYETEAEALRSFARA